MFLNVPFLVYSTTTNVPNDKVSTGGVRESALRLTWRKEYIGSSKVVVLNSLIVKLKENENSTTDRSFSIDRTESEL